MITINLRAKDYKLLAAIARGHGLKCLPKEAGYSRDGADKRIRALCRTYRLSGRAELFYWLGRQRVLDSELGALSPLQSARVAVDS